MDKILVDNIYGFLNYPKSIYSIDKCLKDQVAQCMDIIIKEISFLDENKEFEEADYSPIENSLKGIIATTITMDITDKYKTFIRNYTFLVFNWNENIYKNESIKNMCQHLTRFADGAFIVDESLNYLNEISERLMMITEFEPNSFKLSEHYLNIINEE